MCSSAAKVQHDTASVSSGPSADVSFTNLRDASAVAERTTQKLLNSVQPLLRAAVKDFLQAALAASASTTASTVALTLNLDHADYKRGHRAKNKQQQQQLRLEDSHVLALVGNSDTDSPLAAAVSSPADLTDASGTAAGAVTAAVSWETITDNNGQTYYFNSRTGATQWEKPVGFSDTTVHVLSLAGHRISDAGAEAIARLCQWRISVLGLHTLRLQGNLIGDSGAEALGQCLFSPSCRLAHLHLDGNRIGNRGVKALALPLREAACALRVLQLDRQEKTRITADGVQALANALERDTCRLQKLSLSGNKSVDDACAEHLAEALRARAVGANSNKKADGLQELYLSGTSVADAGAQALAPMLRHLHTVSLSGCRVKDPGALAIAAGLRGATAEDGGGCRLKGCDLQGNYFSPAGLVALTKSAPAGCMLVVEALATGSAHVA